VRHWSGALPAKDAWLDGACRQTAGVLQRITGQPGYGRPVETSGAGFRVDGGADVPAPALGGDSRHVLAQLGSLLTRS
jgi:hypothetical protein